MVTVPGSWLMCRTGIEAACLQTYVSRHKSVGNHHHFAVLPAILVSGIQLPHGVHCLAHPLRSSAVPLAGDVGDGFEVVG